jgi:hypothetical protein
MKEENKSYYFPLVFIPIVPYKTCKTQVQKNNGSSPVISLLGVSIFSSAEGFRQRLSKISS